MKFEPGFVDRGRLAQALREAYGINVRSLTFVPLGLEAACYEVRCDSEARYFLKVWTRLRLGSPEAERQHDSLALLQKLHARDLGLRLPHPIAALDGRLWSDIDGLPFALAPYLEGTPPVEPLPLPVSRELGRTIAAIHHATPAVAGLRLPRETLAVPFDSSLPVDVERGLALGDAVRPGLLELRSWLRLRQRDIEHAMGRLEELQAAALQVEPDFVLCHTDLHPGNFLVDASGRLIVLDWDDAKLAPPEHDLWSGLGKDEGNSENFGPFLRAYREANPGARLHLEHFAFYLQRRYLEDLAVMIEQMLLPETDERDDAMWLRLLETGCYERWQRLPQTLEVISAALRA